MANPEQTDPKEERFLNILRELDRDTTTPEEVAEALFVVHDFIMQKHDEALQAVAEIQNDSRRDDDNLFDKFRRIVAAAMAEFDTKTRRIRKLVDALYEWKTQQEARTTDADIATALDIGDQNTQAIRKVRIALKELAREPGPRGPRGRAPAHEWDDTSIRFANPDGTWGEWVDLRGMPGGGGIFGGGGPGGREIFGITSNGTSGPATLSQSGILNIPQYTGGSGSTQTTADPTAGALDDANLAFDFLVKPFLIVVNQRTYRENHGWTWAGSTATLSATDPGPVGTGGEIYGIIQS